MSWRSTWHESDTLEPLPLTNVKGEPSRIGLATFPAGEYPACNLHGALLRVSADRDWWRCGTCNNGAEWHRGDRHPLDTTYAGSA